MMIETEIHGNSTYYLMEARGIDYTLRFNDDEWELHSHRKALGRANVGSYRFFRSLEELEKSVKSFRGISAVIE
jgi:hypothetical protein